MDTGHLIGFIAAALSCVAAIPHLVNSLKSGTQGVSATAWWLASINSTLWITFAILTHTYATLISSAANGMIAASILFLVYAERKAAKERAALPSEQPTEIIPVQIAPVRRAATPPPVVPVRTPVARRLRSLADEQEHVDRVFHQITHTLELPALRTGSDTGELSLR